jgi:sn-glycerol 3-phosphate transport system substrate-binding protein
MLCPRAADNLALTMFGQALHSMGGTWLEADGRKAAFASVQGTAALEWWVDMVRRHRVSPIPWLPKWTETRQGSGSVNATNPLDEAFLAGGNEGVAMRPLQTFSVNAIKGLASFRWQAVLPPQQPKLASIQGGGNWFMVKGAPHKDTATAFLLHLADAEELALWAVDAQRLPTYKTVVSHPIYQEFLKRAPEMQVHWDTAQGSVTSSPPVVGWAEGEAALRQAILDSLEGKATPSGALREAANVMDAALSLAQSR